jgi:hypothetical protein
VAAGSNSSSGKSPAATVRPPPAPRKAPVAAPVSTHVPITEIGSSQCRFIVDDRAVPAICCGMPAVGGSWCSQHLKIVYTPTALRTVHNRSRGAAVRQ